jgi:hypothetical protein
LTPFRTICLGFYSHSNPDAAPFLFKDNCSSSVKNFLEELLHLLFAFIVALFLLPFSIIRIPTQVYTTHVFRPEFSSIRYREGTNLYIVYAAIFGSIVVFAVLEALLINCRYVPKASADGPNRQVIITLKWMSRVLYVLYCWAILWSLLLLLAGANEAVRDKFVDICRG